MRLYLIVHGHYIYMAVFISFIFIVEFLLTFVKRILALLFQVTCSVV